MGKKLRKLGWEGREGYGRGRREQKIERKKRSRVRIEVHTRMANARFQRGLRHTRRDEMAEDNEVEDQVRKFASRQITA